MRSLYTPMLVLTVLVIAHLLVVWPPTIEWRYRFVLAHPWLALVMALTAAVLLSPVLVAYGGRLLHGQMAGPDIYWRSSPPGVDLLAFVMPNPNSPWFGSQRQGMDRGAARRRVRRTDWRALPLVVARGDRRGVGLGWLAAACAGAGCGCRRRSPRSPLARSCTWRASTPTSPGPWALLRYVPIVGLARSPSRFVVLVSLGVALLFAHGPGRHRRALAAAAAARARRH